MATPMKSEPDGKHPKSHYLYTPDDMPSHWKLRVKNSAGNYDRGLCGAAHAALTKGYRGNKVQGVPKAQLLAKLKRIYSSQGWQWPEVQNSADADPPAGVTLAVPFSVESEEEDGDDVVLTGRFFQAGEYPDKDFALTPDELYAAIAAFYEPVPVDLEHRPMVFGQVDRSGAFGHIDTIWSDDGEWMMARARKPRWLHEVMPETRISATFSRDTKEVIGAAWTATPRVSDAQLVAAFARSRHDTTSGQMAMQHIHDAAVRGGAVCAAPEGGSGSAQMASRHEAKAIQQVHDVAVEHGAACESGGRSPGAMAGYFSNPPAPKRGRAVGRRRMNLKELLFGVAEEKGYTLDEKEVDAMFSGATRSEVEQALTKQREEHEAALKAERERYDAALQALREQQERHAATFAEQQRAEREADAARFAEAQIQAKRVPPAARSALIALAARVSHGDAVANFSDGDKATRVLLEEFIANLPDFSVFTTAGIDLKNVAALFNEGGEDKGKGMSEERRKELLGATPLGRASANDLKPGANTSN